MDKFWGYSSNKIQQFFSGRLFTVAKEKDVVLSGTVRRQEHNNIEVLKSPIEKADGRIILYIYWSLTMGYKDLIIVANDTYVLVLILHCYTQFKDRGVERIWIRIGTRQSC